MEDAMHINIIYRVADGRVDNFIKKYHGRPVLDKDLMEIGECISAESVPHEHEERFVRLKINLNNEGQALFEDMFWLPDGNIAG